MDRDVGSLSVLELCSLALEGLLLRFRMTIVALKQFAPCAPPVVLGSFLDKSSGGAGTSFGS